MTSFPSLSFTCAGLADAPPVGAAAPHAAVTTAAIIASASTRFICRFLPFADAYLDAQVPEQLVFVRGDLRISERLDDRALREEIVAVRHRHGESQILLDEEHRQTVALRLEQDVAELLNEDRRETLGRLVQQDDRRAHA